MPPQYGTIEVHINNPVASSNDGDEVKLTKLEVSILHKAHKKSVRAICDECNDTRQPSDAEAKLKIAIEALNRAYKDFNANAKYVCADRVKQALEKISK